MKATPFGFPVLKITEKLHNFHGEWGEDDIAFSFSDFPLFCIPKETQNQHKTQVK